MTVEEYLKVNNLRQYQLSDILGISLASLNDFINGKKPSLPKTCEMKLKELGIECEVGLRNSTPMTGFDYFKSSIMYAINSPVLKDVLYCFTDEHIEFVCNVLRDKKIPYYCYFKDDCWVVKYDKREDWSEYDF